MEISNLVSSTMATQGIVVLCIYLVGMLGVGFYCNKKFVTNLSGFLTGGRSLGPWIFALTYGSTYLSSSTFIGNTATASKGGLAYLMMPTLQMILLPVGLLAFSHGLRKISRRLGAMTIPEYIGKRYQSPISGLVASLIIIIFMVPYMVGVVKGGAVSLQQLLGVSYNVGVFLVAGVACIYLMCGGYMARCYTDVAQGIMMCIGMVLTVVAGFFIVGGPTEIANKLAVIDPQLLETPGPMGWSNLLLFSSVFAISPWGLPQLVQTNFTIRNKKTVYISAIVLSVWISLMLFGSMILGNMGRAHFGNQYMDNPDNIFPALVLTFFPNVIGALIICAVIAAAMSTIDGVLMTSGSAVGVDIYKKFLKKDASDKQTLMVTNVAMLVIVAVVIIWAFRPPAMLLYFTSYAFSVIAGGLLIPIFMGIFNKKGTAGASLSSIITGTGVTLLWYIIKPGGNYILGCPPFIAGVIFSAIVFLVVQRMTQSLPQAFVDDLYSKEAEAAAYDS